MRGRVDEGRKVPGCLATNVVFIGCMAMARLEWMLYFTQPYEQTKLIIILHLQYLMGLKINK